MVIIIVILLFLIYLLADSMTERHHIFGGKREDTEYIKIKRYKNIAGKRVTIIGEHHTNKNKVIPNKVLDLLKNKNNVVFLEKYYRYDDHYPDIINLDENSMFQLRNAFTENPQKNFIAVDNRRLVWDYSPIEISYLVGDSDYDKEFVRKNGGLKAVFLDYKRKIFKTKILKENYLKLPVSIRSKIDKLIQEFYKFIIKTDIKSKMGKILCFFADLEISMRIINSKYKNIYIYVGEGHLNRISYILQVLYDQKGISNEYLGLQDIKKIKLTC